MKKGEKGEDFREQGKKGKFPRKRGKTEKEGKTVHPAESLCPKFLKFFSKIWEMVEKIKADVDTLQKEVS